MLADFATGEIHRDDRDDVTVVTKQNEGALEVLAFVFLPWFSH